MSDITLGFIGPGSVFGDCDVVSKRPFRYTLKSNSMGCKYYVLKAQAFRKYCGHYEESYNHIVDVCLQQDLKLFKQLATIVYGLWNQQQV